MKAGLQKLLLDLVNYDPGLCLCGHFESCAVCSRSQQERDRERRNKQEALKALRGAGVRLRRIAPKGAYGRERYEIVR